MDEMEGPKAKFERVMLNFSDEDIISKCQDLQSNGNKDFDLLSNDPNRDLNPYKVTSSQEHGGYQFINKTAEINMDQSILKNMICKSPINGESDAFKQDTQRLQNGDDQLTNLILSVNQQNHSFNEHSQPSLKMKLAKPMPINRDETLFRFQNTERYQQRSYEKANFPKKMKQNRDFIPQGLNIKEAKRKLLYFFRNLTNTGRSNHLNSFRIHEIIGDKSDIFSGINHNFFYKLYKWIRCQKIFDQDFKREESISYLFNPLQMLSFFLKLIFTLYNMVFFMVLSIQIVFIGTQSQNYSFFTINCFVWVLEILIKLNTSIYVPPKMIQDRVLIFTTYLQNRAVFDLVPLILLWSLPNSNVQRTICLCICFIKLRNTYKDSRDIQQKLYMLVSRYYFIIFINLLFKFFLFNHVVACLWYLVGQIELHVLNLEYTWYNETIDGDDQSWWIMYLQSMYWSLTLISSGSNNVYSNFQMLFIAISMLFTIMIFGYVICMTQRFISAFDSNNSSCKREDLNIINQYLRNNNISKKLQTQVNIDLESFYLNSINKMYEEKMAILKNISPNLQNQLKSEQCRLIVQQIDFIKKRFSQDTLDDLSKIIQEECYQPNQIIINQHENQHIYLIFILSGQIELTQQAMNQSEVAKSQTSKSLKILNKGEMLGSTNFFTGEKYDETAKSTKFTRVIKISRDQFLEIIKQRQGDLESFCSLRDHILMYQNYDEILETCYFCKSNIHLTKDCPATHLPKTLLYYTNKFHQNLNQSRERHNRKSFFQNTLYQYKHNKAIAKKCIKNLKIEMSLNTNSDLNYACNMICNLTSDEVSSDDNYEVAQSGFQVISDQKTEDKDDNSRQFTKISTKRISQGFTDVPIYKTQSYIQMNTITNNPNSNIQSSASQQMDTIVIESLLNNVDDLKIVGQKSTPTLQYSSKYVQQHKNKQSTQEIGVEEGTRRNNNSSMQQQTSFFNNLDPDSKTEINQNLEGTSRYTKQTQNATPIPSISKSIDNKSYQQDFDLQSLTKHFKKRKSVQPNIFFEQWELDRMRDYTKYFPTGNSKVVIAKYYRYQLKQQRRHKV